MITFSTGDLLHANAHALVNAVNTVGVMGKGIALQFKETFPKNYKEYRAACKAGQLHPGKLLAVREHHALLGEKLINFPTKIHWKNPSRYEYVEAGLKELALLIEKEKINSIAIPALGCGNGGLDWQKVREMIIQHLKDADADIIVFQPFE